MTNEGIKILYCADVHGDVRALELLAASADKFKPNVIICNGDLAGSVLTDEEKKIMLEYKKQWVLLQKGEIKKVDEQLEYMAKAISGTNNPNRGKMYKTIKDALAYVALEAKCPFYFLSGEHDTLKQKGGILSDNLLDNRVRKLFTHNATFAGAPGGLVINGQEPDIADEYDENKAFQTLKEKDPDVAVVHVPPFLEGFAETGSKELADYINEQAPNLVLCAHTHIYGVKQWNSPANRHTVIVNPGNLGAVYGSEGNTFAMITLDALNYVKAVQILKQNPIGEEECSLEVLADFVV